MLILHSTLFTLHLTNSRALLVTDSQLFTAGSVVGSIRRFGHGEDQFPVLCALHLLATVAWAALAALGSVAIFHFLLAAPQEPAWRWPGRRVVPSAKVAEDLLDDLRVAINDGDDPHGVHRAVRRFVRAGGESSAPRFWQWSRAKRRGCCP